MIHIRHDRINRTLCGLVTGTDQRPTITQQQYWQRQIPVCSRCKKAARCNTVAVRR